MGALLKVQSTWATRISLQEFTDMGKKAHTTAICGGIQGKSCIGGEGLCNSLGRSFTSFSRVSSEGRRSEEFAYSGERFI